MELIQIHIPVPIWTKLRTRLPLGLEEVVGYVWTRNSWPLRPFGPSFFRGRCRIMGTRWLPARPFSMIPYIREFRSVFLWRHTGRALRPRHALLQQRFVCYSCTCSCDVTHTPLWRATIAHSYCTFLALCVMYRKCGEDNTHACELGNLMTLGGGFNNDLLLHSQLYT
jgi:hypothetical protein